MYDRMIDQSDESSPWWKTIWMKDHPAWWKTLWWKTTLPDERPSDEIPPCLMKDHLDERPPYPMKTQPDKRPPRRGTTSLLRPLFLKPFPWCMSWLTGHKEMSSFLPFLHIHVHVNKPLTNDHQSHTTTSTWFLQWPVTVCGQKTKKHFTLI